MSHKTFLPSKHQEPTIPKSPCAVGVEWTPPSSLVRAINLTLTIFQGNKVVGLFFGGYFDLGWVLFVTVFFGGFSVSKRAQGNKGN